ncbi:MAG: NfeD family protein [Phycisphaeraceae bacterium]
MKPLLYSLTALLAQNQPPSQDDGTTFTAWGVMLIGLAGLLFVMEVFIPSGGLLGFGALAAAVTGIVLLFMASTTLGLVALLVVTAALPFLFAFALKMWPHTPIGRAMILGREGETRAPGSPAPGPAAGPRVGDTGKALTAMRPVGTCLIEGRREECLAAGGSIEAGAKVRVIAVEGMHVRVRKVEEG